MRSKKNDDKKMLILIILFILFIIFMSKFDVIDHTPDDMIKEAHNQAIININSKKN